MKRIPFKQIAWGATIKLTLARAWASGFVMGILVFLLITLLGGPFGFTELLMAWIIFPFILPLWGLLSLIPMGWIAFQRFIGALLLCVGDPILYILNRKFGIFNYIDLKPINFVVFLYVLKPEPNEDQQ